MSSEVMLPLSEIALLLSVQPGTVRGYFAKGLLKGEKRSKGMRQVWYAQQSDVVAFALANQINLDPATAARLGIQTGVQNVKEND